MFCVYRTVVIIRLYEKENPYLNVRTRRKRRRRVGCVLRKRRKATELFSERLEDGGRRKSTHKAAVKEDEALVI